MTVPLLTVPFAVAAGFVVVIVWRGVWGAGCAELALLGKVSELLVQGKTESAFGGVIQQAFHRYTADRMITATYLDTKYRLSRSFYLRLSVFQKKSCS